MEKYKKDENKSKISKIKKNPDNKLEISEELHPGKNIGSMLGYRIDKKKMNRPS
ncbi:DNA polymerase III [Clostridioides sp. ZZV15-6383]|uniref:DNA polymerase III n=1 Tax=Clostridioides sp. ZZV15-6383 TaxID=2811498 RepID=UPI001D0FFE4D|nr:DNA polymerase III [Clostridioides sp. ZZV15-6383]